MRHLQNQSFYTKESHLCLTTKLSFINYTYLVIAFCSVSPHLRSSSRNREWPRNNTANIQRRVWLLVKISPISQLSKNILQISDQQNKLRNRRFSTTTKILTRRKKMVSAKPHRDRLNRSQQLAFSLKRSKNFLLLSCRITVLYSITTH